MKWRTWENLPTEMKNEDVREYYQILDKKKGYLLLKRIFDIILSLVLIVILSPVMLTTALLIVIDSPGGVFYRQDRVTSYCEVFKIHKFRTMVSNADRIGTHVTVDGDSRITKIGHFLRKFRLDELPQLIDVLNGDMSFVGTRPEAVKYVKRYTEEMYATLLLPAGITSEASIKYKDEATILGKAVDPDEEYINKVLPQKMRMNLQSLKNSSLLYDISVMIKTVVGVLS